MAVSSRAALIGSASFEGRCDPNSGVAACLRTHSYARFAQPKSVKGTLASHALFSSRIFKFPPNFLRQLSNKARRNCSNIGVAQVVAASWSNNSPPSPSAAAAAAATSVDAAAAASVPAASDAVALEGCVGNESLKVEEDLGDSRTSVFNSDGSVAIHAGKV